METRVLAAVLTVDMKMELMRDEGDLFPLWPDE